jgi:predicted ATPase with chaperone activity
MAGYCKHRGSICTIFHPGTPLIRYRPFCRLQAEGGVLSMSKHQSLMRSAMSQLNLSARVYHRILKLSRTIADLAGSEEIQSAHLAEALQYRPKIMM